MHHEEREETQRIKFDELSNRVIGCALEVHRNLGPGLLESTYEQCLAHEFRLVELPFKLQYPLPVEYKGVKLDCGYRIDLWVDDSLIIELKSVDKILPVECHDIVDKKRCHDIVEFVL